MMDFDSKKANLKLKGVQEEVNRNKLALTFFERLFKD
jgi:hypothetical protein